MLTLLWQRTCGYMCFHSLVFVCVVFPRTSASVPPCIFLHDFCRRSLSLYLSFVLYICLCTIFVHVYAVYACICLRTSIHLMVLRTRIFCPSMFCLSLCMSFRLSLLLFSPCYLCCCCCRCCRLGPPPGHPNGPRQGITSRL